MRQFVFACWSDSGGAHLSLVFLAVSVKLPFTATKVFQVSELGIFMFAVLRRAENSKRRAQGSQTSWVPKSRTTRMR